MDDVERQEMDVDDGMTDSDRKGDASEHSTRESSRSPELDTGPRSGDSGAQQEARPLDGASVGDGPVRIVQTTEPPVRATPFSDRELRLAAIRPHRIAEYVLGQKERLSKNVGEEQNLPFLVLLLTLCGIVSAVPYGAAPPVRGAWKIALLYMGSLVICFPSLFVFAQYLGLRLTLAQNAVLALIVGSVAGLFTFGFFPIIWFIDYTTSSTASITSRHLSSVLLSVSFLLGSVHMLRYMNLSEDGVQSGWQRALVGCWVCLLAFITYRMASLLELT